MLPRRCGPADDPAALKSLVRKLALEKEQGARELEQARRQWSRPAKSGTGETAAAAPVGAVAEALLRSAADRVDPSQLALDFALAWRSGRWMRPDRAGTPRKPPTRRPSAACA